jgi:PAP2 superfamily
MHRTLIALALLSGTGSLAVAQGRDSAVIRYRIRWWDGASVAAAGGLALVPQVAGLPKGRSPCLPCDPSGLLSLDHAALHTFSSGAGTASSVLLAGVVGFSGLASLEGATGPQVRGHVAVFANSLSWTLAASEWVKVLAHRSRPVLYVTTDTAAAGDTDNRRSFPSGHAAIAFAAAASYVTIATRERLPHRTRNAILLFGGAVGVSALRVAAGKHFPTDVVGGAALGSAIGWLTARFHPTAP